MARAAAAVVLAAALLAAGCVTQAPPAAPAAPAEQVFDAAAVARGAKIAALGNCAGCHTAAGGAPFGGGLPLRTPYGVLYSSNITPSADGLGGWSATEFEAAMRAGVSRDGHRLYPAFPYDHYTRMDAADLRDLRAFVMTRTPVEGRPPPNRLRFPFNLRPLLAVWDGLYLRRGPFEPDPAQSATWNRGAYLSDALAHCSACHSPRNALGAERSPFTGGLPEGWYAPPLDGSSPSPQPWTVPAMTEYLRTGIAPGHAIAAGPMQGVATALAEADLADVEAIATYVVSLMGPPTEARTARADAARARAGAAAPSPPPDDPQLALGAAVYAAACANCHDLGRTAGSQSGLQMPLAVAVHDADPRSLLRILREGIAPPAGASGRIMPAFGESLTDAQLTALAAWLRHDAAAAPPWPDLAQAVRETREPADAGH